MKARSHKIAVKKVQNFKVRKRLQKEPQNYLTIIRRLFRKADAFDH